MTIKDLRKQSGMTQLEAARKLKINVGFWCRMESGQVTVPTKHFKKVSKMLGVPMKQLIQFRIDEFTKKLKIEVYGH